MYRAITYGLRFNGVSYNNKKVLSKYLENAEVNFNNKNEVCLNGIPVSKDVRSRSITEMVSIISSLELVRKKMVVSQRKIAKGRDCILEGRDIGTVVFPDAKYKFFLDAKIERRAERRFKEFSTIGENISFDEVVTQLRNRDNIDSSRKLSPLTRSKDAILIDSSELTIEQQIEKIISFIKIKLIDKETNIYIPNKEKEKVVENLNNVSKTEVPVKEMMNDNGLKVEETNLDINDYLNNSIFEDVRTIDQSDIGDSQLNQDISSDIENMYSGTFSEITENSLVQGRVVGMNDRDVLIDIGFKSEGLIDRSEFKKDDLPSIGDQVEVYLEFIEDASGNTILSKEKADFMKRWKELNDAFENQTIITGKVVRRIKGGLIVDLEVVQTFLPGSQVDVRPIMDFDVYLDKDIELRIVKFNESEKYRGIS